MIFYIILTIVILQRLIELWIAKRNEIWMRNQGAIEFGESHYPFMVFMHASFFLILIIEVLVRGISLSTYWQLLLALFLVTQMMRIWCLTTLGKYWNTKILVIPGANVIQKGPYQFIRHPNYVIVTIEFLVFPLLFKAYITAFLFTVLNIWMLSVRISIEEEALKELTNYREQFSIK